MRMRLNLPTTANIARRKQFSMHQGVRMEHDHSQF
jgi:hypothetical protein